MEQLEHWKGFLNKNVRVIIEDKPSPIPKHKDGILEGITDTHLILKRNGNTEALRLIDIRRVEVLK
ncbi:hypothetical protein HYS31_04685 [Candidatus Woesearchaeota archaeon]|nr:hypothetical protein [Candidatus Woesearchaeota archaeon]